MMKSSPQQKAGSYVFTDCRWFKHLHRYVLDIAQSSFLHTFRSDPEKRKISKQASMHEVNHVWMLSVLATQNFRPEHGVWVEVAQDLL